MRERQGARGRGKVIAVECALSFAQTFSMSRKSSGRYKIRTCDFHRVRMRGMTVTDGSYVAASAGLSRRSGTNPAETCPGHTR